MSRHVTPSESHVTFSYYVTHYHAMHFKLLYHVMSKHVTKLYFMSNRLYHVMSNQVTSFHVMSSVFQDGWYRLNSMLYKFFSTKMNWTEAVDYCRSIGGNLVTIKDSYIDSFIHNLLEKGKTLSFVSYRESWIELERTRTTDDNQITKKQTNQQFNQPPTNQLVKHAMSKFFSSSLSHRFQIQ